MTMRKNRNQREFMKIMVLFGTQNTKIASLKYLKKPTNKMIPLLILKVVSMQIQIFVSRFPNAWK